MTRTHARTLLGIGTIFLLVALNVVVALEVLRPAHTVLSVSFLNVGQGDSIFIQGPTGIQVLVDGGPDRSVLRELPKRMGPLDRSIDLLVETHPDKDHISGLADVLEQYSVQNFLSPDIYNDTTIFLHLMSDVASEKRLHTFVARRGMRIHLGDGAYADVLYPDRDVSRINNTNDGSIVLHVVYGTTSFMLTGDLPSTQEDYLVMLEGTSTELRSDVLKAGHHGSKFSTSDLWLSKVKPNIVVISAGKENTYGHPNLDAIARVQNEGAKIVSTMDSGTITFVSDGTAVQQK